MIDLVANESQKEYIRTKETSHMGSEQEGKTATAFTEEQVFDAMREVYDPEIPVSVVDLGLIYGVKIIDDWVGVKMTLTTPGCGMGGAIANQIRERVLQIPGVNDCDVRIVWEPMWTPAMMSAEAKKKLGVP
jgi:metal-sulfur cluster biosynthetic enzyme